MSSATLPEERTAPDVSSAPVAGTVAPRLVGWIREHRLMTGALAAAVVLRFAIFIAYRPALEFAGDSYSYLGDARHPFHLGVWHPFGYPVFLWVLSITHNLAVVSLLQHAMGLLAGVLLYRLVRSLGVGSVGGVVAAAPVLFDAYQLDVEQYVLSDTLFTLLVVVAMTLATRLCRHRTLGVAIALGGVLAAATLTRTVGLALAGAVLVVVLVARAGLTQVAAAAAAFALPVGIYALAFHATYGSYGLQGYSGRYLYGTVAPFASCDRKSLPVDERPLCPNLPTYARPGVNQYVWGNYNTAHLPGDAIERSRLAGKFAQPIARHQMGALLSNAAATVTHYFAAGRQAGPRDWFVGGWQFPLHERSPAWNIAAGNTGFRSDDVVNGHIDEGTATVLRSYQRVVFTPGPALALALLAVALACALRRGERVVRASAGAMALGGLAMLVVPAFSAGFDWRYLLPAQAVLVPAGVVAVSLFRDALRRRVGRALPVIAGVAAVAVIAPGLSASSVYAETVLRPAVTVTAPATAPIGDRATVHVGAPTLVGTHCWPSTPGHRWLVGLAAFPASVDYRSGGPLLVQQGNVAFSNGSPTSPGEPPNGPQLPNVLLSSRYAHTEGTIYAFVHSGEGVLRYVDPFGAGAAAWRFHLQTSNLPAQLGSECTGAGPWDGVQLRSLHVTGLSPFTVLPQQVVTYGLTHQAWRADDYDLRFQVASATSAPGPWQYPRTWQHTTLTQQTLLNLTPGATYCFEFRARDALGAATAWSTPRCTSRLYDDTALPKSADWATTTGQRGFYFGTYTSTSKQGATIAVSGNFSRAALTAYRCPNCGVVQVFVGSSTTPIATIDLSSTATHAGLTQWLSKSLPSQQTTLTLKVVSNNRLVAIDGFGLLR